MYRLIEIDNFTHDSFMQNHPKEHFMQSSLWGEVRKKVNWDYKTVGLYQDDNLVASSLLLFRKIPMTSSTICYAPRGFVIDYSNKELMKQFNELLVQYVKKFKTCYIIIDPDLPYKVWNSDEELIKEMPEAVNDLEQLGYRHQGFNMSFEMMQPRFTFRLKLDKTKEEIFANYSKVVRSSMNEAKRINIECKKEENIDTFFDIMQDTAIRNDFAERNKDYYEMIFGLFHKNDMATCYTATYFGQNHLISMDEKAMELTAEKQKCYDKLAIAPNDKKAANRIIQIETQEEKAIKTRKEVEEFIKEYPNGLALSSGITINTKHRCWLVYGGNRSIMRNMNGNYAIKQFEIEDDIEKGFEFVDFFGTIGNASDSSEHLGIHEFKKKFSGDYYEFPGEFHYICKPLEYAFVMKAMPIAKNILRGLKKKKR